MGINLIDTANTHGGERRSEEYIGKTLKSKREQALVATADQPQDGAVRDAARPGS